MPQTVYALLGLTAVVSYLYGSVRVGQREGGRWELRISKSARIQLAILAGLAFGAGATDLRSRNWIRAAEASDGVVILREASALPFATSRKRLWALPRPTATS